MLFITRLFTAAVSFVILTWIFVFLGGFLIGVDVGFNAGFNAEMKGHYPLTQAKEEEVKQEARKDVMEHRGTLVLVAAGLSGVISLVLTFGGLLPWCRRKPPMERGPVQGVAQENGN